MYVRVILTKVDIHIILHYINNIMNDKKILVTKLCTEIENMKGYKYDLPTINNFYSVILSTDFTDAEFQKILGVDNLLESLLLTWMFDERVTSLQEQILKKFLKLNTGS